MKLECRYLESCRGCPLGHLDFEQQKRLKKQKFLDRLNQQFSSASLAVAEFDFVFPVFDRYRTRADFVYCDGHLGWYDQRKKFVRIESCPLHKIELTKLTNTINKLPWPASRGSMRLRVNPEGKLGVWLDLANLDIKQILSDGEVLENLFADGVVVEMGQKGKRVIRDAGGFKLSDPTPYPWFKTEFKNQPVSLFSLISSFTQTNPDLNIQMLGLVKSFFHSERFDRVVEFGSGVGNFTLFLSEFTRQMNVIENDFRNLIPLRYNLDIYGLTSAIAIFENVKAFLSSNEASFGGGHDLYFVNPARSGVGALFDSPIPAGHVAYVSCHLESFLGDAAKLEAQGFKLIKAILFDQFPHSEHFEILSYFRKG